MLIVPYLLIIKSKGSEVVEKSSAHGSLWLCLAMLIELRAKYRCVQILKTRTWKVQPYYASSSQTPF